MTDDDVEGWVEWMDPNYEFARRREDERKVADSTRNVIAMARHAVSERETREKEEKMRKTMRKKRMMSGCGEKEVSPSSCNVEAYVREDKRRREEMTRMVDGILQADPSSVSFLRKERRLLSSHLRTSLFWGKERFSDFLSKHEVEGRKLTLRERQSLLLLFD